LETVDIGHVGVHQQKVDGLLLQHPLGLGAAVEGERRADAEARQGVGGQGQGKGRVVDDHGDRAPQVEDRAFTQRIAERGHAPSRWIDPVPVTMIGRRPSVRSGEGRNSGWTRR
jgi:hypothetical protein